MAATTRLYPQHGNRHLYDALCLPLPQNLHLQARCLQLIALPQACPVSSSFFFLPFRPFSFLFFPYLSCTVLPILLSFVLSIFHLIKVHLHTPRLTSTQIISSCLIMSYVRHSLRPCAYFGMALYFRKQLLLLLLKASEPVICANQEISYKLF